MRSWSISEGLRSVSVPKFQTNSTLTHETCLPFATGYLGINEQECEEKGCCWSPADVRVTTTILCIDSRQSFAFSLTSFQNQPWCFYKNRPSPNGTCHIDAARTDCGNNICFEVLNRGNLEPQTHTHTHTNTHTHTLGYVGIDQAECETIGCCWSPKDVS